MKVYHGSYTEIDYQVIDTYFNSKTYSLLIDENTGYYEKSWQEIYEMLKKELKLY